MKAKIEEIVKESVEEILSTLKKENINIRSATFFGSDGFLDSLGLVSLIVILEEKIQAVFNVPISLANEKALSTYSSPFRNCDSLVQYIQSIIPTEAAHE